MKTRHILLTAMLLCAAAHAGAQYTSYTLYLPITPADFHLSGPVKEISSYGENPANEAHWTTCCRFDRDGRLTEYEEWSYGGGELHLYHYTGSRLDSITLDVDNAYGYGWFYSYDDKGCPAMQIQRYVFIDTIRYTCDKQCRIMEEHAGQTTTRYTYDTNGRITTMSKGDVTTCFEYNALGHKTKQTTQNGDFIRTETYTYNDHGDMTEYRQFSTNDIDTSFTIQIEYTTYDHHGNWTARTDNEFLMTRTIKYFGLDTALTTTEDSVSFDRAFHIRMRNIMAVWVDSTGALSLNHDYINTPPPPPPPGEEYEYVDDRVPTDLGQLREKVKRFLANSDDADDLPQKRIEDIPLLGERPVSMGLVALHTLEGAPEATVDSVRHEIAAAIIELRDSLSLQLFGLRYGDLPSDKAAAIRAAIPTSVYNSTINRFYKIASDD